MAVLVNVDNFVLAETHRMFADIQAVAGGIGSFRHNRTPARIDEQTVIRLNRDTLYSFAIVDLAQPAHLRLPDAGGRYLSAMIVNEDHFVNSVLHEAGEHTLTSDQYGSRYVLVGVRILVDPNDPADVAAVAAVQDRLAIEAGSSEVFVKPDYDVDSLDATRDALLALARGLTTFDRMFGARADVDPVRHLIGCAAGWVGCPPLRRRISASTRKSRSATTSWCSKMFRSTRSGRCRCTTRGDSSSRTRRTSTRSTVSPAIATTMARSPCVSLPRSTATSSRTRSSHRRAGTTSFASTGLVWRFSMVAGRHRRSRHTRPHEAGGRQGCAARNASCGRPAVS